MLIGQSFTLQGVKALIRQVATSSASVIIRGETGTGKELVARMIYELSKRRDRPYIAINCAALPEALMESELFGHEQGAFTGAERRREGCFELANGGTLLLDEISDLKFGLQAKLLRVLEESQFRRLGGTTGVEIDVRVLAASNRRLEEVVRAGSFREDLYHRLNVFQIEIPPLRARVEDIPELVAFFLETLTAPGARKVRGVDPRCVELLKSYAWPGNVRELRNVIEHAMIVTKGPAITAADLPPCVTGNQGNSSSTFALRVGASLDEVERELIFRTLDYCGGNKSRTVEVLGISIKTLYNRLKHYQGTDVCANGRRPPVSENGAAGETGKEVAEELPAELADTPSSE